MGRTSKFQSRASSVENRAHAPHLQVHIEPTIQRRVCFEHVVEQGLGSAFREQAHQPIPVAVPQRCVVRGPEVRCAALASFGVGETAAGLGRVLASVLSATRLSGPLAVFLPLPVAGDLGFGSDHEARRGRDPGVRPYDEARVRPCGANGGSSCSTRRHRSRQCVEYCRMHPCRR